MTVTPEFGPPYYQHTQPFSDKPIGDAWELNNAMKKIFEENIVL